MGPGKKLQSEQRGVASGFGDIASMVTGFGKQLTELGMPALKKATEYYTTLASGDPQAIATAVAPATQQITSASEQAKKNIEMQTPRGGAQRLGKEYADIQAAGQIGNLTTQAFTSAPAALAQLGQGQIGLSINEIANAIAAMGGQGEQLGAIGAQKAAGKEATMGFLGDLVGGLAFGLGGKEGGGGSSSGGGGSAEGVLVGGCWIAEAVYGTEDPRTYLVRYWLNTEFMQTTVGAIVMGLYQLVGRPVASLVRRSRWLREAFKPLFDLALERAKEEL